MARHAHLDQTDPTQPSLCKVKIETVSGTEFLEPRKAEVSPTKSGWRTMQVGRELTSTRLLGSTLHPLGAMWNTILVLINHRGGPLCPALFVMVHFLQIFFIFENARRERVVERV
jgi:hypothetical protein